MTFFESLLVLLLAAIALLQVARRLSLPYPAMLAGAGVIVALIPGAPSGSVRWLILREIREQEAECRAPVS